MKRLGGVPVGGIESNRVVDVPSERMASPGADRATTVAGLSPVNGAITHAKCKKPGQDDVRFTGFSTKLTRIELPALHPPWADPT